jgi:membrane-associated protease RseP (regulator of RpoE activity)
VNGSLPSSPIESPQAAGDEIRGHPVDVGRASARREWLLPAILFAVTFLSTTFAGLVYAGGDADPLTVILVAAVHPSILLLGLPFSLTLITILLAHEMGHFLACRYYGIKCTPPFFIPFPFTFAGTLGAFIRIKSPFRDKRALFDVGVAGPLAGFVFVLPALVVGISYSRLIPRGGFAGYSFGEPLLFRWVGKLVLGYSPVSQDMIAHPIAIAAWFGLLVTCLNLFPIWQLDGGHIAYAVFGREPHRRLSILAAVALILVSFLGWPLPSYLLFGVLLLIMGFRSRFYHPPTLYDEYRLGSARIAIGILALVILIICFTPVPVSIS